MKQKQILDQRPGILTVQLSHELSHDELHLQETLAQISRWGARIAVYDSAKETQIYTLTPQALETLLDAWHEIQRFWQESPLSHQQVLLDCGCKVDWDTYNSDANALLACPPEGYLMPAVGDWTYCFEHQEGVRIHRFNAADFGETQASGNAQEKNQKRSATEQTEGGEQKG